MLLRIRPTKHVRALFESNSGMVEEHPSRIDDNARTSANHYGDRGTDARNGASGDPSRFFQSHQRSAFALRRWKRTRPSRWSGVADTSGLSRERQSARLAVAADSLIRQWLEGPTQFDLTNALNRGLTARVVHRGSSGRAVLEQSHRAVTFQFSRTMGKPNCVHPNRHQRVRGAADGGPSRSHWTASFTTEGERCSGAAGGGCRR